MGRQIWDYWPSFSTIRVQPKFVGRCFIEGDLVFKKDLPNARFTVGRYIDDESCKTHPVYIPISRAMYNQKSLTWEVLSNSETSCLVHRDELIMADTIHDPMLRWTYGVNPFKENWVVSPTSGPYKTYIGRVRKVWRTEVEVELEAMHTIVKFKPQHLAR